MIRADDYQYKSWQDEIDGEVDLYNYARSTEWSEFFGRVSESTLFNKLNTVLTEEKNENIEIYPYPSLVFKTYQLLNPEEIKVVIIGQDPYPLTKYMYQQLIPDAMGVSFSVPYGSPIPESLESIQRNLKTFMPLYKTPNHGNLESWVNQGCLMMNASLTVRKQEPGSHTMFWRIISDKIIRFVSASCKNVVFVLWGNDALNKINLIDQDKHKVIISSHPSSKSCDKPLQSYSSFDGQNHFGLVNKYLREFGETPINWQT